ncbi:MAG: hypothetical protein FD126_1915 [Elusimicrobia bacterium]|nr:MAG: hypothetical protein FD126_1915 [Elusimicrobiota bacterium]
MLPAGVPSQKCGPTTVPLLNSRIGREAMSVGRIQAWSVSWTVVLFKVGVAGISMRSVAPVQL